MIFSPHSKEIRINLFLFDALFDAELHTGFAGSPFLHHGVTALRSADGHSILMAVYGTSRGDTMAVCEDDGNDGFSLLFNWNLRGAGSHTVRALAEGAEFARRSVTVGTAGAGELSF